MPPAKPLIEGEDYYLDEITGLLTFTAKYLRDRGYCCENGCRHCPYSENQTDLKSDTDKKQK